MSFAPESEDDPAPFRICFVCTGNICRSPMAEVVFRGLVDRAGYSRGISVSSAGTGDWHVGEQADARTIEALARRGHDGSKHRARQFDSEWFDELDLIVAFDRGQERILKAWAPTEIDRSKVQLLLSFDARQAPAVDIPDPYYSDAAFFDTVLGMIEKSSAALFAQVQPAIKQGMS
jgi:protein-tyrosine phosphatase